MTPGLIDRLIEWATDNRRTVRVRIGNWKLEASELSNTNSIVTNFEWLHIPFGRSKIILINNLLGSVGRESKLEI